MPRSAASDLGLFCSPRSPKRDTRLIWVQIILFKLQMSQFLWLLQYVELWNILHWSSSVLSLQSTFLSQRYFLSIHSWWLLHMNCVGPQFPTSVAVEIDNKFMIHFCRSGISCQYSPDDCYTWTALGHSSQLQKLWKQDNKFIRHFCYSGISVNMKFRKYKL